MAELFKMATGNAGQDTLTSNFSETLDTIFEGFGASTEDSAGGSMSLGMGGTLDEDDAGSMAATPRRPIRAPSRTIQRSMPRTGR
jgi:hypothetical protein